MKHLFLVTTVLLALTMTTKGFSQSCPIPDPLDKAMAMGTWQGNFTLDGEIKSLQLDLSEKNNALQTQLLIPFISKVFIQTDTEICQSEELHVKFQVDNKDFELVGRINNNTMSGKISSRNSSPFTADNSIQEIFSLKKSNSNN